VTTATEQPAPPADPPAKRTFHELRDVQGPSALGGGWRRFWDLLLLMSVTAFKTTYYGSVLGYVWSLLRPAILFAVLLVVFTKVFHLKSTEEIEHYPEMLLVGIVLFTYFQESTAAAVTSVVGNEGIVRKTHFPRLVIPLSTVVTGTFNLLLSLIPVFIFLLVLGVEPTWTWLLIPVILVSLFILTAAVAMILSALYVRYRDVAIIWGLAGTVLLYGSPILYPYHGAPGPLQTVLLFNPLTPILSQARQWIVEPDAPSAVTAMGGFGRFSISVVVYIVICVGAVWIFNREAPRIAEDL
jgi:ABC-2 type transport system permease protein